MQMGQEAGEPRSLRPEPRPRRERGLHPACIAPRARRGEPATRSGRKTGETGGGAFIGTFTKCTEPSTAVVPARCPLVLRRITKSRLKPADTEPPCKGGRATGNGTATLARFPPPCRRPHAACRAYPVAEPRRAHLKTPRRQCVGRNGGTTCLPTHWRRGVTC